MGLIAVQHTQINKLDFFFVVCCYVSSRLKPWIHSCSTKPRQDNNLCVPVLKGNAGPALHKGFESWQLTGEPTVHADLLSTKPLFAAQSWEFNDQNPKDFYSLVQPLIGHLFTISFISRPIIPLLSHSKGGPPAPPSASFHLLVILRLRSKPLNPPHIIIFPLVLRCPSQASLWVRRGVLNLRVLP